MSDFREPMSGSSLLLLVSAVIGTLLSAIGAISSVFIVGGFQNALPLSFWIGPLLFFIGMGVLSFLRKPTGVQISTAGLCVFLAIGTFFLCGVSWFFGKQYSEPITVASPDGAYEVTFREWASFPFSSGAKLSFRKTGRLFASKTVEVYTGDYIFPFSEGDYELIWEGNAVTVRYVADHGEEHMVFYRFEE